MNDDKKKESKLPVKLPQPVSASKLPKIERPNVRSEQQVAEELAMDEFLDEKNLIQ